MTQITLTGYIIVPSKQLAQVRSALVKHIQLTRQEAGCLSFSVSQDPSNPLKFHVNEAFIDQASFEFHQSRVKKSYWGRVSQDVERHYKIKGLDNQ
jgi:quinol monooxygenase YgiN